MIDWLSDHFDYYPGDRDDDEWMNDYDQEDEWRCEFGVHCLMPGEHMRSECYNLQMAQAWQDEQQHDAEPAPLSPGKRAALNAAYEKLDEMEKQA
jgi:hypothetical protein